MLAERWAGRLADLLEEYPDAEADLRVLVQEIQAALPAGMVSAADHAVAAGRDVNISATSGGVAAGVIHGNVTPPDPTRAGPGEHLAGPGIGVVESGAIVAVAGGVAVGQLQLPEQRATAGQPVRLAPRPALLAGREELLAALDARLSAGDGPAPRIVALYGLGGAGKTSVAVEYAYRHLAEVGVAWQFAAEDATVLAAGFARAGRPARRPGPGRYPGPGGVGARGAGQVPGAVAADLRQRGGPGLGGGVPAPRRARAGADHQPEPELARPGAGRSGARPGRRGRVPGQPHR